MALPCISSSAVFFRSPKPNPPVQQLPHLLLLRPTAAPLLSRKPPRASSYGPRRPPNFPPEGVVVVSDPRAWRELRAFNEEEEYQSDDDDGEEDDDRSLDLLVRFLHNVFRKVSRRVRKAVRSVLPVPISTKLVGFSVDGVLILAFLWILKAFLETLQCVVENPLTTSRGSDNEEQPQDLCDLAIQRCNDSPAPQGQL